METSKPLGTATEKVGRNIEQAKSGAHEGIERVSEAARPTVDRLTTGAHEAVDSIANAASQAAETLEEKGMYLKEAQSRFVESASNYVHEHPVASLGIAVATGFVLSRLLSSGGHSSSATSSPR